MTGDSRRRLPAVHVPARPGVPGRETLFSWGTRNRLRTSLRYNNWALPVVFAAGATILGLALPYFDRSAEISIGLEWDPSAATAALGAIISGSLALVGFVYTVTLLVLQLQYQFSPRLIRLLARMQAPKIAIGALVGSTIYALLVIRAIDGDFVPQLSTMLALIFASLSIFAYLVTVGQLLHSTRTSEMISQLAKLTRPLITQLYPESGSPYDPRNAPARPHSPESRVVDYQGEPGVLIGFDTAEAAHLARASGATLYLEPALGEFVHRGSVLLRIDDRENPVEDARLRALVLTGNERTFEQDPAYGFRLLVDMANSAMPPVSNDPTTVVQVLDELDDLLRTLAPRQLRGAMRSGDGSPWLYYRAPSWEDYVGLACNEIRFNGSGQPQVARRMRAMLKDLEEIVPKVRRPPLERQLELLESSVARAFSDPQERAIAEQPDRLGFGEPQNAADAIAGHSSTGAPPTHR